MGLLSKVKSGLGIIKNKAASALSGISGSKTVKAIRGASAVKTLVKYASPVAKVGLKVGKFAIKRAGVVGAVATVGGLAYGMLKKKKAKVASTGQQATAYATPQSKKTSLTKKLLTGAAIATGVGAAAYGIEQVAEKLGVRGGAGFFGKRPSKRRKGRGRYAYIKVRRNRRGKGKLTKSEESRLRSMARTYANSEGTSRRRSRKGKRPYPTWLKKYMFKKGKRRRR